MDRLKGKVAIITGATSGIGRTTAKLFAAEGASVAVVGRREPAGLQVVQEIADTGGEAHFFQADVSEEDSVRGMVAAVAARLGGVDILYNNAGGSTSRDSSVVHVPLDEFWRAMKLDLFGTFLCSRFAIPEMIRRGGGSIINSGSIVAMMGIKKRAAYTATKGGVVALTRSMAVEFAARFASTQSCLASSQRTASGISSKPNRISPRRLRTIRWA
jgi:NAD(P)-dependent dehydrogenase (short-subunit alcohol dehydrogenase family)